MLVKTVALLTMLSMSINGFLPKSITDLSGNSFLLDAISCQTIFLDFLHFSDRSLIDIAVRTVDELTVSAPVSLLGGARSADGEPWVAVCRTLSQSTNRLNSLVDGVLVDRADPAVPQRNNPSSSMMLNTTSDYILLNNAVRMDTGSRHMARGYVQTATGICMIVSRLIAGHTERVAVYDTGALRAGNGYPPQIRPETLRLSSRIVPPCAVERFSCYLPRSGIDASAAIRGIF